MLRALRLLACVLVLPLVGGSVALVLRARTEATFNAEVGLMLPPAEPRRTLAALCAGPDADGYEACRADAGYRQFATASFASGAAGLLLLVGIALAGAVARSDRRRLLVFRPGLYVTATIVTALINIHALIALVVMTMIVRIVAPGMPLASSARSSSAR